MNLQAKRVIAVKGSKNIQVQYNGDRSRISVCVMFNQEGKWLLHFILKGKSFKSVMARKEALAALAAWEVYISFTESATQNEQSFNDSIVNFVLKLPPTVFAPKSVIVADGHASHGEIGAVMALHEAGHDLVTIPAHASHVFNGFDRAVARNIKLELPKVCIALKLGDRKQRLAGVDVSHDILMKAICIAMTHTMADPELAASAFQATGIFPLNRNVVPESIAAPARAFGEACLKVRGGKKISDEEGEAAVAAVLPDVDVDVVMAACAAAGTRRAQRDAKVPGGALLTSMTGSPRELFTRVAMKEVATQQAEADKAKAKTEKAAARVAEAAA